MKEAADRLAKETSGSEEAKQKREKKELQARERERQTMKAEGTEEMG